MFYKTLILLLILVLFIILLILKSFKIENFNIKDNIKLKEIELGPFKVGKDVKLYVYNPSIDFGKDGKLYCVSRLTGRHSSECNKKDFKNSVVINRYINKFPDEYKNEISLIIYFPVDNPSNFKILHDFDTNNLCREKWIQHSPEAQGLEDPRLFTYKGEQWVYSHYRGKIAEKCQHSPSIFKVSDPQNILTLYTDDMSSLEKNWMPFEYEGELYFEYNISPHTILKCDMTTGYCYKIYETDTVESDIMSINKLGGGSPSKLFTDTEGIIGIKGEKYFLGFAHTRLTDPVIRKNFFYVFEAVEPFSICMIGSEIDVMDYKAEIEFGSGMVIKNNKKVIISCGISDCFGVLKEYDLVDLLKSLRKV